MGSISAVDEKTGRKFYLDDPDDLKPGEKVTFLLNLHGGGSVGAWQKAYFPAVDYKDKYRLVVATPSAATKEPARRWVGEADDEHLHNIVEAVFDQLRLGEHRRLLARRPQPGRHDLEAAAARGPVLPGARRRLAQPVRRPHRAGRTRRGVRAAAACPDRQRMAPPPASLEDPACDFSFIFAVGEHEIKSLPQTSPWAEKYGAGPRQRRADIVDVEPGQIYDSSRIDRSTKGWGLLPRPGTAQVFVYPNARDGRVIADVVRLDKGHTEGLEPKVTEELIKLIVSASGGKARKAAAATATAQA